MSPREASMANQLKMATLQSILHLHSLRWSQRRIAAELQVDRETVSRYLRLSRESASTVQIELCIGNCSVGFEATDKYLGSCAEGRINRPSLKELGRCAGLAGESGEVFRRLTTSNHAKNPLAESDPGRDANLLRPAPGLELVRLSPVCSKVGRHRKAAPWLETG